MMSVIMKTRDGTRSGFLLIKLVLKFPARKLLHIARAITITVAIPPYSSRKTNESSAAPMIYSLHDSFTNH